MTPQGTGTVTSLHTRLDMALTKVLPTPNITLLHWSYPLKVVIMQ